MTSSTVPRLTTARMTAPNLTERQIFWLLIGYGSGDLARYIAVPIAAILVWFLKRICRIREIPIYIFLSRV